MRTHPDEPDKKILDYLVPDAERSITPTGDRGLVKRPKFCAAPIRFAALG
jgi:hypothetical protein